MERIPSLGRYLRMQTPWATPQPTPGFGPQAPPPDFAAANTPFPLAPPMPMLPPAPVPAEEQPVEEMAPAPMPPMQPPTAGGVGFAPAPMPVPPQFEANPDVFGQFLERLGIRQPPPAQQGPLPPAPAPQAPPRYLSASQDGMVRGIQGRGPGPQAAPQRPQMRINPRLAARYPMANRMREVVDGLRQRRGY